MPLLNLKGILINEQTRDFAVKTVDYLNAIKIATIKKKLKVLLAKYIPRACRTRFVVLFLAYKTLSIDRNHLEPTKIYI